MSDITTLDNGKSEYLIGAMTAAGANVKLILNLSAEHGAVSLSVRHEGGMGSGFNFSFSPGEFIEFVLMASEFRRVLMEKVPTTPPFTLKIVEGDAP